MFLIVMNKKISNKTSSKTKTTKASKGKILVIGSMNMDMVVKTQRIPAPGETLLGGVFGQYTGGKGANQAVAAKTLFSNTFFCAGAGNDAIGAEYLKHLKKTKLDTSLVKIFKGQHSGVAVIMVSEKGENAISVAPGANMSLTPAHMKALDFSKFSHVVLQLETPINTVVEALSRAKAAGCTTILTPAPAQILPKKCLKNIDILVPNEHEILLLSEKKEKSFEAAAASLLKSGVKNILITLGSKGSMLINAQGKKTFGIFKVKVVDTVGAGDCFTGSLAAGLCLSGGDMDYSIKLATSAASLAVTKMGAQSFSSFAEVKKLAKL